MLALMQAMGCGDEGPKPPAAKKGGVDAEAGGGKGGAKKPAAGAPAAAPKGGAKPLRTYDKIPDADRREFRERDFIPDPTGVENRDPFRSYVVNQPGLAARTSEAVASNASASCKPIPKDRARRKGENWHGGAYSVRDFRLVGIVLRGTQSYALFRDPGNFGNIVYRRDCLGKEKAIVEAITAGFVRLEVIPEAPPGGKTPEPEKREIALHPQELQLPDEEEPERGDRAEAEPR
jgi:hypothetical protein